MAVEKNLFFWTSLTANIFCFGSSHTLPRQRTPADHLVQSWESKRYKCVAVLVCGSTTVCYTSILPPRLAQMFAYAEVGASPTLAPAPDCVSQLLLQPKPCRPRRREAGAGASVPHPRASPLHHHRQLCHPYPRRGCRPLASFLRPYALGDGDDEVGTGHSCLLSVLVPPD